MLTVEDDRGNESGFSNEASAEPGPDETPPTITSVSPPEGYQLHDTVTLSVTARDNVAPIRYRFEYSQDGESWTLIGDGTGDAVSWDTTTVADCEYQVRVTVSDARDNSGVHIQSYSTFNALLPSPESLLVEPGEWTLTLSWAPRSEAHVKSYRLFRSIDDGPYVKIVETTATLYINRNLSPDRDHAYRMAAIDKWDREGVQSDSVTARPLQETTLPAMRSLEPPSGTHVKGSVQLEATAGDEIRVREFVFDYSTDGGQSRTEIGRTPGQPAGRKTWTGNVSWDTSALADGEYTVRTRALNEGDLEDSLEATYTLDRTPPAPPSDLAVSDPHSGTELDLAWSAPADTDVESYQVFRALNPGGPYQKVAEGIAGTGHRDTGLDEGVTYNYVARAVDQAGNPSDDSAEAGGTPVAQTDLAIVSIETEPSAPPRDREASIVATVQNNGPGAAQAKVAFYLGIDDQRELLGQAEVAVAAGQDRRVSLSWTPLQEGQETISAELSEITPQDLDPSNDALAANVKVNVPPAAPPVGDIQANWGEPVVFDATGAQDPDGAIGSFLWEFGDGVSSDKLKTTHAYTQPGEFAATLTVTDNDGADDSVIFKVTVTEVRADLVLESLDWDPLEPEESDLVTISATIQNAGAGPTLKGFFATYYIDGLYAGFQRINTLLNVNDSVEITFPWVAAKGVHVVRVVADDIQDNVAETNEVNNHAQSPMTAEQVFFPDLLVTGLTVSPEGPELSAQERVVVRATVRNQGSAAAEDFLSSIFLDGEYHSKRHIARLGPDEETTVSFALEPLAGTHSVEVMADDVVGTILESDEANNSLAQALPEYEILFPNLSVASLRIEPGDDTLPDGSTLTFLPTIANGGAVDVLEPFTVALFVDGKFVEDRPVGTLAVGATALPSLRWRAKPGQHDVRIVVDAAGDIEETDEADNVLEAETAELQILYPDLTLGNVIWAPQNIRFGDEVVFNVPVTNQSIVSTLSPTRLVFRLDGEPVHTLEIGFIGGRTTLPIQFKKDVNILGEHEFRFQIDVLDTIIEEDETNNTATFDVDLGDSLVVEVRANGADPSETLDETGFPPIYTSVDTLELTARVFLASDPGRTLTDDDGVVAQASITRLGQPVVQDAAMPTLVNPSRVELRNVRVEAVGAPGIEVIGSGIGIIPPESAVTVGFLVNPGDYSYLPDAVSEFPLSFFRVHATFVEFDPDTLLPREGTLSRVPGSGVTRGEGLDEERPPRHP